VFPRLGLSPAGLKAAWQDAGTRRILSLMAPALLGVGVAQLSLIINTQIASYLTPGSVSWISYADRLMEFPIALLGVALGVVLMPQLASAQAKGDADAYSAMLDWGLRLVYCGGGVDLHAGHEFCAGAIFGACSTYAVDWFGRTAERFMVVARFAAQPQLGG